MPAPAQRFSDFLDALDALDDEDPEGEDWGADDDADWDHCERDGED